MVEITSHVHFPRVVTNQPPFYCHYTGQSALACTSSKELEDFVGAKFHCPHAFADRTQCIWIREKILEFLSAVCVVTYYIFPSVVL